MESLDLLADDALLSRLDQLAEAEKLCTAELLACLAEVDRRGAYKRLGYSSLFDYCIRCLEYSPSAAGRRIQVARCIRRYPPLLELLEARELSLSAAALIASILTIDNYKSILEQARGASHRDVEKLVAQYRPPLELRDRVQPVRVAVPERPAAAPANDQTQPTLTPGAGSVTSPGKSALDTFRTTCGTRSL